MSRQTSATQNNFCHLKFTYCTKDNYEVERVTLTWLKGPLEEEALLDMGQESVQILLFNILREMGSDLLGLFNLYDDCVYGQNV